MLKLREITTGRIGTGKLKGIQNGIKWYQVIFTDENVSRALPETCVEILA